MRLIEINTTQNVTIQYELASLKERIFAFIADFAILAFSLFTIFFILMIVLAGNAESPVVYLIIFPLFFFYSLAMEYFMNGQSFGKRMQNLKIIKLNGKQPELNDYIIRWAFRALDIYFSSGALASILIGSSNKAQRLGDVLAGTVVVKIKPTYDFSIADLLKLQSIDDYAVSYPSVKKLSEDDMLMVKTVLERYNKYPNEGHRQAVFALSDEMSKLLQVDDPPKSKIQFLNTLIKDYIMTTR